MLVISGICVWAVSPETDTNDDRDSEMELGVKRIFDMRVFAVTASSSLFAYVWLWIVLLDQQVYVWEGVLTFLFFFVLVIFAYWADKYTKTQEEKKKLSSDIEIKKEDLTTIEFTAG